MAGKTIVQSMEDLVTVYQTFFFDLPLTGTKWGLGLGKEQEITETAWKGYGAWVVLATATIDNLYRTPMVGEVVAHSLDTMLRWQRLSNALVGASFAGLWPTIGLPTATAVQGLRTDVHTLREELRAAATDLRLAVSLQANGKLAIYPPVSLREERHSPVTGLFVFDKESVTLTTDLSDYFEPVADSVPSAPAPEYTKSVTLTTDLSDYFEPVADSVPSAPARGQKVSNKGEALQTELPGTKRALPRWSPYSRAGGRAANKKTVKGNTLR